MSKNTIGKLDALELKLKSLRAEESIILQDTRSNEKILDAMNIEIAEKKGIIKIHTDRILSQEKELKELREWVQKGHKAKDVIDAENAVLTKTKIDAENEIKRIVVEFKTNFDNTTNDYNAEIAKKQKEIETVIAELEEKKKELVQTGSKIDDKVAIIVELRGEIKDEKKNLKDTIKLNTEIAERETVIKNLKIKMKSHTKSNTALQEDNETLTEEALNLTNDISEKQKRLDEMQKAILNEEAKTIKREGDNSAREQAVEIREKKLHKLYGQLKSLFPKQLEDINI